MAARTHLKRVRGRYFWRARTPADLSHIIGRRELHRPLGTADPAQARHRAVRCTLLAEALFETIRQHRSLARTQAESFVRAFLEARFDAGNASRAAGPPTPLPVILPIRSSPESPGAAVACAPAGPGGESLSAVVEKYLKEQAPSWRSRKTRLDYEVTFRLALEIIGDKPARAITRDDVRALRDRLQALPPNFSRAMKNPTLGPGEDTAAGRRLAPKSVNKYLLNLSALFNWARREELMEKNPAEGLTVHDPRRPDEQRAAFSPAELQHIFTAPLYTGCLSERERFTPGPHVYRDYKFWMGPLSLFMGLRLGEVLQLEAADVEEREGIPVVRVTEERGRRLKTEAARRLVPIHPELVRIGFLRFVEEARQAGHSRLFPDTPLGADGYYTPASKWYARFLHSIGLSDSRLTFHSYRHTFTDTLKQAGVEESVIQELVGHEGQSITLNRYGKAYRPRMLSETLKKLDYGLDFRHLYAESP